MALIAKTLLATGVISMAWAMVCLGIAIANRLPTAPRVRPGDDVELLPALMNATGRRFAQQFGCASAVSVVSVVFSGIIFMTLGVGK